MERLQQIEQEMAMVRREQALVDDLAEMAIQRQISSGCIPSFQLRELEHVKSQERTKLRESLDLQLSLLEVETYELCLSAENRSHSLCGQ